MSNQSLEFDCQHDNHDDEEEEKNDEEVDNKDGDGHWSVWVEGSTVEVLIGKASTN